MHKSILLVQNSKERVNDWSNSQASTFQLKSQVLESPKSPSSSSSITYYSDQQAEQLGDEFSDHSLSSKTPNSEK